MRERILPDVLSTFFCYHKYFFSAAVRSYAERFYAMEYYEVISYSIRKTPQIKLGSFQKLYLTVLRLRLNIYKAPTVS